ncbi:FMN-binding protein [Streptomyces sp. CB01881]|uniref:FMN-binding protein n=1 Tax=Streptomyces sp. CB01881 TaxID=2078691 RepID=UPI000CDBE39E|nr:FMN-binding protein [Streptomyces sp. CB01881]AUY48079.1 FMN-binding protein [Streptomyces sp. CB01881]TYC76563.1 FMN-binding protein [Streptomyces sp. CB01881]
MRRAVVTCTATAAGVILLLSLKPHDGGGGSTPTVLSAAGPAQASSGASVPSSGSSGSSSASSSGSSSVRTVTGDAVPTRYGPVQVKVTLDGTKITKVDVVKYPTSDRRDREINASAIPVLNQEALAAQSADVDVVSGATYTSDGYTRSLQSALDQAGR